MKTVHSCIYVGPRDGLKVKTGLAGKILPKIVKIGEKEKPDLVVAPSL
jgi:hypothetical protein